MTAPFNITEYLVDRHVLAGRGNAVAAVERGSTTTYAELLAVMNRAAFALATGGLRREDRCLIALPDSVAFLAAFLGAMRSGAVPVPVNPGLPASDYAYFLQDSGARCVVITPSVWSLIEPILPELPRLQTVFVLGASASERGQAVDFATAAQGQSGTMTAVATDPYDVSYWLYTSGTTGRPKGVVHLHEDMVHCVQPYVSHVLQAGPADRFLSASRLYFSYGLVNSLYLPLTVGGSVVLCPDPPTPERIFELIEAAGPTVLFTVPTAASAMIAAARPQANLGSVRLCVSAGEPLPEVLYRHWRERFGVELLDGIGSTEFGYIYVSNRPGQVRPGSSGRTIPPHRTRIVDSEGGTVAAGEIGELQVMGESTAIAYWHRRGETRSTFIGPWLATKDLFRADDEGYLYYQGRADDMLKVGGIYVSPIEVELVLREHPLILEAAVVGHPDEHGLVKARALLVLNPGEAGSDQLRADIVSHVKRHLAPYKCPRWIDFLDELPKTATGKLQRHKLRQPST